MSGPVSVSERKPRILWVGESSFLSTGFSTLSREFLERFHSSDKYEIFELGAYGYRNDPRSAELPWKYMGVLPDEGNEQERRAYESSPENQFGAWRFEEACLRFRPDVVCDIRDIWYAEHECRSPYRPFFHHILQPTVDAAPQDEQWISILLGADAVFTYSDWAKEILHEQSRGKINLKGSTPAGADYNVFKPVTDRRAHREVMGIDPDCLIVGTVMRNQRRKLYPDLIQAFAQFLKQAPSSLAQKTFLYMHTSWPDVGWDIPRLILEAGVGHKCVFTYFCRECGAVFPNFFADAKTICRRCGSASATFPTSQAGVTRDVVAAVLNLFDVYVQYANSEGQGLPQVEAAACGVPVMAVDYSAMSDVVRKLGGYPIKVQRLARESETHCWRALPDNDDFVKRLISFLSQPSPVRANLSRKASQAARDKYDYDRSAKAWMNHFDSVELRDEKETWLSPPRFHSPAQAVPQNLSNEEFVRWGLANVAGRPELVNSYMSLRMVRDLNWGATLPGMGGLYFNEASMLGTQQRFEPFDRERCYHEMLKICEHRNMWEQKRASH